jgi:dCMP deaminase
MDINKALKYMALAEAVMDLSKDPSTKVGAVALDDELGVLCVGYNGFPRGVKDLKERLDDRPTKYAITVHAEGNIVAQAARKGISLEGATIVVTSLYPCSNCAALMVQAGVKRIITTRPENERWIESNKLAEMVLTEGGVEVIEVEKNADAIGGWSFTKAYQQKRQQEWNKKLTRTGVIGYDDGFYT